MQYQSECLSALKSIANIHKPFEKTFMETMKLFMAIPDRINFLQLGRYGCFSEQTYLAKSFIHNAYMLERFICVFGINPDQQVIDKLFKELILFTARSA